MSAVFGTLMWQSEDGTIVPGMAAGAEVVDPRTVNITLRPGVKFTDGSAYDADAVRTSLLRARTPATPAAKGGQDPAMKALEDVKVVDPLTVLARLKQPLAGEFLIEMSQRDGAIMSPKQIAENPGEIDTKPVGAGPFTLVENTPQQQLSLRKNPGYWDAANVRLGGVDIVNTPTGPQQVNGLLAGSLDWASYVPVDNADSVGRSGGFTTQVSAVFNVELAMCTGKPPFDNETFRQAVQLGTDRDRYAKLAFAGKTVPAYSFYREENKNFDKAAKDVVKYDPERAKQLLATAGVRDTVVDLHYPTPLDFGGEAEVLQSQLQAIGIRTNIVADRDIAAGFIVPQKPGAMLFATIGSTDYGVFARHFAPGGLLALCGADRPDVMQAVNEAAGLAPDDPAAVAAYQRAQQIVAEHAYVVPIVAYPTIAGWNTARVGGTPKFSAFGYPEFDSIFVKN
ncbi:MAG TPA: ABC transporter substrate-binding protein [Amycolatopsis sp.]|uniref:ABC transporter substrate-binding protein n=1 Tax=Amycolatopsis sp. TaxID=37632 RepID=UPI002B48CABF|nr:ABC transporter substrate-binding protein [Amycolatopsis sp.]HKS47018.1 ABC transporter substrate-binding protein [Amycolatopsis sp.]